MTVKKERRRGNICKIGASRGPGTARGTGVKEMDQTESPSQGGPVENVQRKRNKHFWPTSMCNAYSFLFQEYLHWNSREENTEPELKNRDFNPDLIDSKIEASFYYCELVSYELLLWADCTYSLSFVSQHSVFLCFLLQVLPALKSRDALESLWALSIQRRYKLEEVYH